MARRRLQPAVTRGVRRGASLAIIVAVLALRWWQRDAVEGQLEGIGVVCREFLVAFEPADGFGCAFDLYVSRPRCLLDPLEQARLTPQRLQAQQEGQG